MVFFTLTVKDYFGGRALQVAKDSPSHGTERHGDDSSPARLPLKID